MKSDGVVIIETTLENSGIDKGIANIEAKMEKLRKKAEEPFEIDGVKVTGGWNLSDEEQQYYDRLEASLNKLNVQKLEMLMTDNKIAETLNTQSIKQQQASSHIDKWVDGVMETEQGTRIVKKNIDEIGENTKKVDFSHISQGLTDVIKKVTKWGLAVFGVRSAYNFVRQSISTLAQSDDGLATKLEYIRWALANTIKPIIEWIIKAVFKLLGIFGGLIKAITGFNIFSKSSVSNFEKIKSSTGAIKSNTASIKKNLYGWDEMTRVEESNGILGNLGGVSSDIDDILDKMPDLNKEVDSFAQKIKNWVTGGKTLKENAILAIKNVRDIFKNLWSTVSPWFKENVIDPLLTKMEPIITFTKEKIVPEFKHAIDSVKEYLSPLTTWFKENVLDKIKEHFSDFKDRVISVFAPFMNTLIDMINSTFGIFGVNLKHIDTKVDGTGNNINKEINGNLWTVINTAQNLAKQKFGVNINSEKITVAKSGIGSILDNLKTLGSKTWKIVTNFVSNGVSKATSNSWLDPIRNALGKIGINLPRLAKGTILNYPGKGVPVGGGSAIGGEAGREAYLPLSDDQLLEELGSSIGRHVTINANIINTMNGRIISRELHKINNQNSFANNG